MHELRLQADLPKMPILQRIVFMPYRFTYRITTPNSVLLCNILRIHLLPPYHVNLRVRPLFPNVRVFRLHTFELAEKKKSLSKETGFKSIQADRWNDDVKAMHAGLLPNQTKLNSRERAKIRASDVNATRFHVFVFFFVTADR